MPQTAPDLWPAFATPIVERLGVDDDPALWQVVVETIIASTEAAAEDYSGKARQVIRNTAKRVHARRRSRVG